MPLLVIMSMLVMGLAQAAHVHKPDADSHDKTALCVLCLHGNHMADAPVAAGYQVTCVYTASVPPLLAAPGTEISSASYLARAPPAF